MKVDQKPAEPQDEFLTLALLYFQRHLWIYVISVTLASIIMVAANQWWLFWPLAIWSSIFLVHYLIVKSLKIDNAWVEDRTLNTAYYAYDLDHIVSIRKKIEAEAKKKDLPE